VVSRLIAKGIRTRRPSVLVLSLPRSGSSWVGDMLGGAPDALYLREPMTQGDPAVTSRVVFNPDENPDVEPIFRRLSDRAFLGWPDFGEKVVRAPGQWALRGRRGRRVVIKDVNPLACHWFLDRYRPRVVFLVRHPAAVAVSSQRQGWLGPTTADWAVRGRDDARILRTAWEALEGYPDHTTVRYEALCTDPLREFQRLYEFAGLTWTGGVAHLVAEYARDSARKIDEWRGLASPAAVEALRRGYEGVDLPWFGADDPW
jgi:hypothetical protein